MAGGVSGAVRHSQPILARLHDLKCMRDRKRSSNLLQVADGRTKIDRLCSGLTGKLLLSATVASRCARLLENRLRPLVYQWSSMYAKRGLMTLIITRFLGGSTLSEIVVDLILARPVALNGPQASCSQSRESLGELQGFGSWSASLGLNLDLVKLHSRWTAIAARTKSSACAGENQSLAPQQNRMFRFRMRSILANGNACQPVCCVRHIVDFSVNHPTLEHAKICKVLQGVRANVLMHVLSMCHLGEARTLGLWDQRGTFFGYVLPCILGRRSAVNQSDLPNAPGIGTSTVGFQLHLGRCPVPTIIDG
ncbi:uncharacterized protein MYCFIDRAFT_179511 [Pseudocercospora fijiensis CIRAD86]|uniref:Uncharacterized protein n=1 Tax=Pseudocercospora fijiensis (strain CIRAD86) TaxID=383855 RepID=M3ALN8_PSEFD|nr:uncharacterized protein MYCFIDRAFT_179511 [Pseudocercospora fijiensis CIRAD86]EME78068.1 hypothetical protein MYCFIDRAFT_179511 [Pseudocercospora fijiensis CIRAD86]